MTRLRVENYRSIKSLTLDLHEDATLLVGPNGAGKSNIIDALMFLGETSREGFEAALKRRDGLSAVQRRGTWNREQDPQPWVRASPAAQLTLEAAWEGGEGCYHTLTILPDGRLGTPRGASLVPTVQMFDINPGTLRAPQTRGPSAHLASDGSNLNHVWSDLLMNSPETAERVVELLRQIVPSVSEIGTMTVGRYTVLEIHQQLSDGRTMVVDGAGLSDGTLRALALLVAVHQPDTPDLVAIEEPEKALHPHAAELLFNALLSAPAAPQLLISTHSPAVLTSGRLDLSMVRVVEWRDGQTLVGPIATEQRREIVERLTTAPELLTEGGLRLEESGSAAE